MVKYTSVILKFFSLGFVIAAGSFWAGGEVHSRPKYRDEQTLVGGAVWTQTIIPIGLIISTIIDEDLHVVVHAYFLLAGFFMLLTTGLVLIIGECKTMRRRATPVDPNVVNLSVARPNFDKIYFVIGILSTLAALCTFADFIVIII